MPYVQQKKSASGKGGQQTKADIAKKNEFHSTNVKSRVTEISKTRTRAR